MATGTVVTPDLSSAGASGTGAVRSPTDLSDFHCSPEIKTMINQAAAKYDVPPRLIAAVIQQESGFKPKVESPKGALGLMQMIPTTATAMGCKDPKDPAQAIDGGTKYLSGLLKRFNGNVSLALAGYNAGPGAVINHHYQVPPYDETRKYVASITTKFSGTSSNSLSIPPPSEAKWAEHNVPTVPGSSYGILPQWMDNLESILKVPDNARSLSEVERQLKDQIRKNTGKDVDDAQIKQYLRTHYGKAIDSSGNVKAGTEIHVPHLQSGEDGLKLEDGPPYELLPPDTRPTAVPNPALAGEVRLPVKG
jgi:hypothetical protein